MSYGISLFISVVCLALSWAWISLPGLRLVSKYERRYSFQLRRSSLHLLIGVTAITMWMLLYNHTVIAATVSALIPLLVTAGAIDILAHRLPLILTTLSSLIVALGVFALAIDQSSFRVVGRSLGFGLLAFVIMLLIFVLRLGVGFGDVLIFPIMTALCAMGDASVVLWQLLFTGVFGGFHALYATARKSQRGTTVIAYGPSIIGGALAALIVYAL
ncbi:MAG: hypothetical protein Q4P66_06890 [Actinomycetaceae bacterium]|nr:hypothetical protein [Actinomycetaceae bacterium]